MAANLRPLALASAAMLSVCGGACSAAAPAPAPAYVAGAPIALPDGRWDYASFDPVTRRVYVARADSVTVVDPANPQAVRSIGVIAHGHAAFALPGGKVLVVTSGHDNTVRLLDTADGHQIASIPVDADPDYAFYDATSKSVLVMNAKAGTVSRIDTEAAPEAAKVVATITLKPALEAGVMASATLLVINNEDLGELDLADVATGTAQGVIPMPGCEAPTGIAFIPEMGSTVSACANGKAAVVDIAARKLVALLPIGMGPDAAFYDAPRRRVLIPCGKSAAISVFTLGADKALHAAGAIPSGSGARTAALDPADGTIYLPSAAFAAAIPGSHGYDLVPGSMRLLRLTPAKPE